MSPHRAKKSIKRVRQVSRHSGAAFLQVLKNENQKLHRQALLFQQQQQRKMQGLLESEEKYRVLTEKFPNMIFINQGGKVVYANPRCEEVMGYKRKEFYALEFDFLSLMHPKEIPKVRRNFLMHQKGKEVAPHEYRMITKGREVIHGILTSKLIHYRGVPAILWIVTDITERKRAEEDLKQSFSLQRATLESTADGILVVDGSTGKVTDFNERFAQLWRIPKKVLESYDDKKLLECVLPQLQNPKKFFSEVQGLYRHSLKNSFDVLEFKDGRIFERYSHPQLVDGKPVGRVWSFRDVTDRKLSEKMLQESEKRYRNLFESSQDAMMTIEPPSWRFTSANTSMVRMFKTKNAAELFSHSPWALSPKWQPDGRVSTEKAKEMIRTAIRKGSHFFEWTHRRIDGKSFPTEVLLTRVEKEGEVFIQATVRDITERKEAEDSLREHRHQLLQIIDTVPHMIFVKDRQGRFLLVNRATAEAYQKEPKDLIGVRRQDIHQNRQEAEEFLKGDREVLTFGKSMLISNEPFTDVQGRKHILQTIKIPFNMAGIKETCILGVSVDATEQRKVEEFRNDIVRTVSHELRTPLSIEKEGISLLMDGVVGPVNLGQKEILETVMRSIERLARMITSLLDISSIETGKIKLLKKRTDLVDLVKDVAFEFKKRAGEKGIDLSVKSPGHAVQVFADADKIAQVLGNLVDNAIKFTPRNGAVEISLAVRKNVTECEVRDTGIGIASENVAKAFEKFQQFSRKVGPGEKGFGLGLAIAKGIVEMHGGRIWIKSKPGEGTWVTFSMPLFQKEKD